MGGESQTEKPQERHLRVGSLTSVMLAELAHAMTIFDMMATYQGRRNLHYYGMFDLDEMAEEIAWEKKQNAIKRLKQQKLIECRQVEKKFEIALTQKGAQEALRLKILNAFVLENGTDCIVVFDIPEHLRRVRIELGKFLESAGFVRIQRSVFISPFDAAPLLVKLFRAAGLKRGWVRVYYAKEQP